MHVVLTLARNILLAALALFVLTYAGDYAAVRVRMLEQNSGNVFEAVTYTPTYYVAHKDGRAEFVLGDPQTTTCLHAVFPHLGDIPCWYLKRTDQEPIAR